MSIQKPVSDAGARPVLPLTPEALSAADPSALYFAAQARTVPQELRALTALDQMYTYFGGDRA